MVLRAVAKAPSAREYFILAKVLERLKLYPAAIEAADKTLWLGVSRAPILLFKAQVFGAAGDVAESRKHVEEALKDAPGNRQAQAFHRQLSRGLSIS